MEQQESNRNKGKLQPEDFYMENGFIVFTEVYHLRRGYCCKSGCRHCPYGKEKTSDPKLERR